MLLPVQSWSDTPLLYSLLWHGYLQVGVLRQRGQVAREVDKLEAQLSLLHKHERAGRAKKAMLKKKEMELKVSIAITVERAAEHGWKTGLKKAAADRKAADPRWKFCPDLPTRTLFCDAQRC